MDSKISQFPELPPGFLADCRFLLENGRHNFETLEITARTLVEHIEAKKAALLSDQKPSPRARILSFPVTSEAMRRTREHSLLDLISKGFNVWGYRWPTIKCPSPVNSVYAMMEKDGVFYEYVYSYGDGSDPVNCISEIPKDRLLECYKRFGPRTGRLIPPKMALRILTRASGCTALESEPGGT
ncbi:MAG TPA: hypothetical protein P5117_03900 [Spirochaetia bacterium]|nr:hypothetical protein [Spirochaetales bacterium]HRY79214.1 hypothetical protein [Spirochaetia bacterium]HRZ88609.1 hypothetical protein [Spirochaetia bacterium]